MTPPTPPRKSRTSPPDPRYVGIRVDANFFHLSLPPEDLAAAEALICLAEESSLSIVIPHTVRTELDHPNAPAAKRARAARLLFTLDTGGGNYQRLQLIKAIMRGNAADGKHDADATHLYDTALWQASYFVTCDRRILARQQDIADAATGLWIVRPSELLKIYQEAVGEDGR